MNDKRFLLTSIQAAIEAGDAILQVYHSANFQVEEKADSSPLTLADRRSHDVIMKHLSVFDFPILSEEGQSVAYEKRKNWDRFWLIDPLDGTKEFIKKNGEFTVNIAMIRDHKPIAGVIFVPDRDILYFASDKIGSYRADFSLISNLVNSQRLDETENSQIEEMLTGIINQSVKLPVDGSTDRPFAIAGSRSHSTPELEAFVEEKRREYGEVEFISAGSSLKLCLVAEGRADIYPRTGPTMEWDTAAGQAIVENAGGKVFQYDTDQQLEYNKENLLNPWFVVYRQKTENR
jgi:3'(2'), 5'-bisphosphate nucleotidase